MEPKIRYVTSADGVRIALHTLGRGRPCVIVPTMWLTSGAVYWHVPETRANLSRLAERHLVAQYDSRGYGLSDRDATDYSPDARVGDLAATVDSLGAERVDLVAIAQAGSTAMSYAATHPERVSRLILADTLARGRDIVRPPRQRALRHLLEVDWQLYVRTVTMDLFNWTDIGLRVAQLVVDDVTPDVFLAALRAARDDDVSGILPQVRCPTLVLHGRASQIVSLNTSRQLAAAIPGARFAMYENTHPLVLGEDRAVQAIESFLDEESEVPSAQPSTFRTVLFTDLVGHAEMMSLLGDERGREVLREHERITREVLKAHSGTEVKTMGDGFMASFGSVTKAVECAIALQHAFTEGNPSVHREALEGLSVRVGLNAGEPIEEDGDLFGATVILASRIAAKAEGGEILVADTVRGLCSGKGFLFADRGEFVAKGFEEPVRMYEVRWQA